VALGDVTGNAKPELAAANFSATSVSVYRNAVLPPPRIGISSGELAFPEVAVGDSAVLLLSVRNLSTAPLTLGAALTGTGAFRTSALLPTVIPGNDSLHVPVLFQPPHFGTFRDTLRLSSNGGDTLVVLSAASPFPNLTGLPDTVNFGPVPQLSLARQTFRVTNTSVNLLRVDSIVWRAPFSASLSDTTLGLTDTASALVGFRPETLEALLDSVVFVTNALPARRGVIVRGSGLAATVVNVGAPWSLVSVPRVPSSLSADSLFPGREGVVFGFQNLTQNYDPVASLAVGPGYWVKYGTPENLFVTGNIVDSIVVDVVREGWVLFGSITRPVQLSGVLTAPPGAVISPVFRFNAVSQLYEPAAEIRPGDGHWVKVDRPCRLIIR
jgi:hypothetical protein